MGYAQTVPTAYLEVHTAIKNIIEMDSTLTNYEVNDLYLPSYKKTPDYAYLDITSQGFHDTSGALNEFTADAYIGLVDTGGTTRNAGTISTSPISLPANFESYAPFTFTGYNNIASYLGSGATQMVKLMNAKVTGHHLQLRGCYGRLRVYWIL